MERDLGRYDSGKPGPTVLVCGGLHGNEPAGVEAARRVLARLEAERPVVHGTFRAVTGNVGALKARRRFLSVDLNRAWTVEAIRALHERDPGGDTAEEIEQRALLKVIDEAVDGARGPFVLLDLHTTSGASAPFTLMSDTLRNRRLAFALPIPVLLGLEESVDGTLLEYVTEHRHTAAVIEAGQHDDPLSVDLHEAVIWAGLVAVGVLSPEQAPGLGSMLAKLREACRGLPRVAELRHTHRFESKNGFRMEPGFRGFQRVRKGDLLARDARGDVCAPMGGRLLMPLYQEQGAEGFYIIRRVSRVWLMLSSLLRRLKLHVLLPLLPGVRWHEDRPNALRVNPRIARYLVVEIFHLFGFRRRRPEGDHLVFSRRRPG